MTMPDNTQILVQCRKCDECIAARKRNWIGKLVAEQATAKTVWFATFTYGGGYENDEAYIINYRHLQLLFKKIRKAGYTFKYIAVGEHGTKFERAHFHVLFFFDGPTPPVSQLNERIDWSFWDHGKTQIEHPRSKHAAAVYLMDYMDKDNLTGAKLKYSKHPQLGIEYMLSWAEKHAKTGVTLFQKGNSYTVDIEGQQSKSGENFFYPLDRSSSAYEMVMNHYFQTWAINRPGQKMPLSQDTRDWLEDISQNPQYQTDEVRYWLKQNYDVFCGDLDDQPSDTYNLMPIFDEHWWIELHQKSRFTQIHWLNKEGKTLWSLEFQTSNDERDQIQIAPLSAPQTLQHKIKVHLNKPKNRERLIKLHRANNSASTEDKPSTKRISPPNAAALPKPLHANPELPETGGTPETHSRFQKTPTGDNAKKRPPPQGTTG